MSTEGIIGTLLGILGLVTGYVFYRKGLRVREPSVSFKTFNLIKDHVSKLEGLDILYKGKKVANLSVTKIIFWNNGSETIDKQDIAKLNPLAIVGRNNTDILEVKVVSSNNAASQFTCALTQDGDAEIEFEYLDRGHGAVVQVIHTGLSSDDIIIAGQIKGVSAIKLTDLDIEDIAFPRRSKKERVSKWPSSVRRKVSFAFWFLSGLFFTCIGGSFVMMLIQNGWKLPKTEPPPSDTIAPEFFGTYVMGPMFLLMGLMLLFIALTILFKRIPRGLESFDSDPF